MPYPLQLRTLVRLRLMERGRTRNVLGEIRGRTFEENPHYDVMIENGMIVPNVHHSLVTRVESDNAL